ncbi:VirB3 family type IV secretion system protein [Dickeya zeae]|uniref:VirB3 family type IV secretion system protein n=1 Tax=Dickeya zeae TaxID=204042 RepID=UPI002159E0AC|nr:VirB3 family type IV secretion system protein [Dickeya zeae]
MTTLNKALTRPAAIMGLVPFVLVSGATVLLSVYVSHYLALLLIPAWLEMRAKARADIHYFGLLWLVFKTRGRFATNRHFGATAMLANQYDAVDISEFTDKMKLNARITLDKYIPYSSHLHPHVIRNRHGDFVASWELGGTLFECEDEHHLTLMASHLNNLIRAYEGLPVTFYIHRIRETYQDAFEATSGTHKHWMYVFYIVPDPQKKRALELLFASIKHVIVSHQPIPLEVRHRNVFRIYTLAELQQLEPGQYS